MIKIQNISTSFQYLAVNRATIKTVNAGRFAHLSDAEYNYATSDGLIPLTGVEMEDNSSYIWEWISPLDAFGNPIVPVPPIYPPIPTPSPEARSREGIEDTIQNGVTDYAPSENAVYDALALKAEWQGGSTRPTNPKLYEMWFDTTLDRPVFWSGSRWVDLLAMTTYWYEGSLTVSDTGSTQIPFNDLPISTIVDFTDPTPPPPICAPIPVDTVSFLWAYTPTPSPLYTLKIDWEINTGGTRDIGWQVTVREIIP